MLGNLVNLAVGFNTVRLLIGAALLYRAATVTPDGLESAIVLAATAAAGGLIVATCRNGSVTPINVETSK